MNRSLHRLHLVVWLSLVAALLVTPAARADEPTPATPMPTSTVNLPTSTVNPPASTVPTPTSTVNTTSAVTIENTAPPVSQGPLTSGLIVANQDGLSNADLTARWSSRISAALTTSKVHYVTGNAMLTGAAAKLGPPESQELLGMPELLLASTRAPMLLATQWVVLVDVGDGDNPMMRPIAVNVTEHDRHPLSEVKEKKADDTLKQLALEVNTFVDQTVEHQGQPVIGNVVSKLYHTPGADHTRKEECIDFTSEKDARAHGYEPCSICFPKETNMFKNDPQEVALGREVSAQVEQEYKISRNRDYLARVQRVGHRIADANGLDKWPYTFTVLESDEMNAFSAGAGNVFITTGLLRVLEEDDELATVLGHEMGHCECHHVIREYRQAQTMNIVGVIIGVATGTNLGSFLTSFMGNILMRGHSRVFEAQADHMGILFAYGAGYSPEQFVFTLRKLKEMEKIMKVGNTPNWLRTHPTEDKRIESAQEEINTLVTPYDKMVKAMAVNDPGAAEAMQHHIAEYAEHQDLLNGFASAWKALNLPAVAPTVNPLSPNGHPADADERD
ncbi:MAG: M48 family metalloprotease [Candidatus Xenobia bacterium]